MARLTDEQVKKYLEEGGCTCPFCDDGDLEGGPVQLDAGIAWQTMKCHNCNKSWDDMYTLTGVDDSPYEAENEEEEGD